MMHFFLYTFSFFFFFSFFLGKNIAKSPAHKHDTGTGEVDFLALDMYLGCKIKKEVSDVWLLFLTWIRNRYEISFYSHVYF